MSERKHRRPSSTKRDDILALIDSSFKNIQYPGDDGLVVIRGDYDLERREILDALKGKHWRTIPLRVLRYNHQSLFFLTPEAYRFYLPAYLRAIVASYERAGNIPGSVVFSLTAPEDAGPETDIFFKTMNGFNRVQKATIRAVLEFLLSEHSGDFPGNELRLVIDGFWRKFNKARSPSQVRP